MADRSCTELNEEVYKLYVFAREPSIADKRVLGTSPRRRLWVNVNEGLAAIRCCGIVHGDVKAGNILVSEDPRDGYIFKIADFGCTVFLDRYRNMDSSTLVRLPGISQPWAAPETGEPVPIDHPLYTDVYSLGLLIFQIFVFFGWLCQEPDRIASSGRYCPDHNPIVRFADPAGKCYPRNLTSPLEKSLFYSYQISLMFSHVSNRKTPKGQR